MSYEELEYKFDAQDVSVESFLDLSLLCPEKERHNVNVRDTYYMLGTSVLRHRVDPRGHELTVKRRKSGTSLRERIEINLGFSDKTSSADVEEFLFQAGYTRMVILDKIQCDVFKFKDEGCEVEVCLYTVGSRFADNLTDVRKFIEIEVADVTDRVKALLALERWKAYMTRVFQLSEPLNQSLFEIYTK